MRRLHRNKDGTTGFALARVVIPHRGPPGSGIRRWDRHWRSVSPAPPVRGGWRGGSGSSHQRPRACPRHACGLPCIARCRRLVLEEFPDLAQREPELLAPPDEPDATDGLLRVHPVVGGASRRPRDDADLLVVAQSLGVDPAPLRELRPCQSAHPPLSMTGTLHPVVWYKVKVCAGPFPRPSFSGRRHRCCPLRAREGGADDRRDPRRGSDAVAAQHSPDHAVRAAGTGRGHRSACGLEMRRVRSARQLPTGCSRVVPRGP